MKSRTIVRHRCDEEAIAKAGRRGFTWEGRKDGEGGRGINN